MKVFLKKTPYSSVVGGGIQLVNENGEAVYMFGFMGTTRGISKEVTDAIADTLIAKFPDGFEIPD